jgi:hypothetical protein
MRGAGLEGAADDAADGVGGDTVSGVGDPLADALLGGLAAGRGGEAEAGQDGFVGEALERDAEGGTAPGAEGGLDFDKRAVDGAGEGAEDPVDALEGELAFFFGEAAASDVFGEDDGGRGLALDARGKDLFGDHFCAGAGESADEAGEGAFGDAAIWVGLAHRGVRCVGDHDSPGTSEKRVGDERTAS